MASLADVREALVSNLSTITGVQWSAYMLANPTLPYGEIVPAETEFDLAMDRGLDRYVLTVRVFVGQMSDIGAQKNLDEFLAGSGARSVKAAVEAAPDLGGACDDLRVTGVSGYRQFVFEGKPPALGAEWRVEVIASGS